MLTPHFAQDTVEEGESTDILAAFPFYTYFQTAPQPIFPSEASREDVIDISRGCQRHIDKIFTELDDIR